MFIFEMNSLLVIIEYVAFYMVYFVLFCKSSTPLLVLRSDEERKKLLLEKVESILTSTVRIYNFFFLLYLFLKNTLYLFISYVFNLTIDIIQYPCYL